MLGGNPMDDHGEAKTPSPFLTGTSKVDLPKDLGWLKPFYNEASEDFLKRLVRARLKSSAPAYLEPPFQHTVIDMLAFAAVAAAGGTGTVLQLTAPENEIVRIRFYGQDITAVVPPLPGNEWNFVRWTFRVNGVPLEFYDNFLYQRGAQLFPAETTIILEDSDLFEIVVTNNDPANAYNCWAFIRGWRYSKLMTKLPDEDMMLD